MAGAASAWPRWVTIGSPAAVGWHSTGMGRPAAVCAASSRAASSASLLEWGRHGWTAGERTTRNQLSESQAGKAVRCPEQRFAPLWLAPPPHTWLV